MSEITLVRSLPSEDRDLEIVWCGSSWRSDPSPAVARAGQLVARAPRLVPPASPVDRSSGHPRRGLPRAAKPVQDAILRAFRSDAATVVELATATGYSRKQIHQGIAALRRDGIVEPVTARRHNGQYRLRAQRMSA